MFTLFYFPHRIFKDKYDWMVYSYLKGKLFINQKLYKQVILKLFILI